MSGSRRDRLWGAGEQAVRAAEAVVDRVGVGRVGDPAGGVDDELVLVHARRERVGPGPRGVAALGEGDGAGLRVAGPVEEAAGQPDALGRVVAIEAEVLV